MKDDPHCKKACLSPSPILRRLTVALLLIALIINIFWLVASPDFEPVMSMLLISAALLS